LEDFPSPNLSRKGRGIKIKKVVLSRKGREIAAALDGSRFAGSPLPQGERFSFSSPLTGED
jgi:hypothetical protein